MGDIGVPSCIGKYAALCDGTLGVLWFDDGVFLEGPLRLATGCRAGKVEVALGGGPSSLAIRQVPWRDVKLTGPNGGAPYMAPEERVYDTCIVVVMDVSIGTGEVGSVGSLGGVSGTLP